MPVMSAVEINTPALYLINPSIRGIRPLTCLCAIIEQLLDS